MIAGLEVPEFGDDLEAVVDGVAAAASLPQYLPVFEPVDDVFDAGLIRRCTRERSLRMIRPEWSRHGVASGLGAADVDLSGGEPGEPHQVGYRCASGAGCCRSVMVSAGYEVTLPKRFVLAGHSLGGSLVAGFSQPQNIEAAKTLAVGWVNDMFAGTHHGIYGAPQHSIQIDTSADAAPAVVLPFTSTQTVQATPFDGLLSVVLDFLAQNLLVYEPLAGRRPALAT
jgi:hypothetical protein